MAGMTLRDVARTLKDIDFVLLNTHTENGRIAGRPMSNNREVEYDGDSWFYLDRASRTAADVADDPNVTLSVQGAKRLLGGPPLFLSIEGRAEIVTDAAALEARWTSDLKRWWPEGPRTPGIALLRVRAERIHYWDGEDEGEVPLG